MRLRTTKRLLNLASLLILSAAGAVGYWGMLPMEGLDADARKDTETRHKSRLTSKEAATVKATPATSEASGSRLQSLVMNSSRALRRPLFDPPQPAPVVVAKPVPQPIRVIVLATVIEAENSTTMLKLAKGDVVFRKVGEALGPDEPGAVISKIETGAISIRRGQEELRLSVEGLGGK